VSLGSAPRIPWLIFPIRRTLTGQQFRARPDFTICLIQAALIYAADTLCVSKLCDLHIAVRLMHTLRIPSTRIALILYVCCSIFPVSLHTHHIHPTKLWLGMHSMLFSEKLKAKWKDISVSLFPWDQLVTLVWYFPQLVAFPCFVTFVIFLASIVVLVLFLKIKKRTSGNNWSSLQDGALNHNHVQKAYANCVITTGSLSVFMFDQLYNWLWRGTIDVSSLHHGIFLPCP
jgi:hypothetical protein